MESQQVEKVLQQNSSLINTNYYLLIQGYCIDMQVIPETTENWKWKYPIYKIEQQN